MNKRIVLFCLAVLVCVGCVIASERIASGICTDEQDFRFPVLTDGSEAFNISGCEITDQTIRVTGSDPHFVVSAGNQTFSRIRVAFLMPVEKKTELKIYYVPVGGTFSEDYTAIRFIEPGSRQAFVYIPRTQCEYLRFDFEQDVRFEGIYIGDREWIIAPYRLSPVRIGVIFLVLFIPLFLLIIEKTKDKNKQTAADHQMNGTVILCNLFLSLTVLFFQPLESLLINQNILRIRFENTWWIQLLLATATALVLSALMRFLPKKARAAASALSLGLALAFLAQSLLLNDGRPLRMNTNWPMELLNIHVWFGIVIITAVMIMQSFSQTPRRTEAVMKAVACVMIVIQVFNFMILATVSRQSPDEEPAPAREEQVLRLSLERGMPELMKGFFQQTEF